VRSSLLDEVHRGCALPGAEVGRVEEAELVILEKAEEDARGAPEGG
jgi:hypothetical protein